MKKTVLLVFIFFVVFITADNAQTNSPFVIASMGDFFSGSNFSNSSTVAEMTMVETFTNSNFILTQGFQQTYDIPTSAPSLIENGNDALTVFPNPTTGFFNVIYELPMAAKVNVRLYNALGATISEK